MAKRWAKDTPKGKSLPQHVKKRKKSAAVEILFGKQADEAALARRIAPLIVGGAETAADAVENGINNPDHPWQSAERALVTGAGGTLGWLAGRHFGQGLGPWGAVAGEALGAVGGGLGGAALSRVLVPEQAKQDKDEDPTSKEARQMHSYDWIGKLARDLSPGSAGRAHLSKSQFVFPHKKTKGSASKGAYPIPDRRHAAAAEGFCAMHHGANSSTCEAVRHKVEEKFGHAFEWIRSLVQVQ